MAMRKMERSGSANGIFFNTGFRQPPFSLPEIKKILRSFQFLQQILSSSFILLGIICVIFTKDIQTSNVYCATIFVGIVGIIAWGIGNWSLGKEKDRIPKVFHLFACIIAAVSTLIQICVSAKWLFEAYEAKEKPAAMFLHWILLVAAVTHGVSFILTAAFICYSWDHQRTVYSLQNLAQMLQPMLNARVTHERHAGQQAFVDFIV